MPENCKTVFILNREHEYSIREIAKKLRKPIDTVEKQLRRAFWFLSENPGDFASGEKRIKV
jgi:DNA-directed RNA polymerase specialized sigma24 family protein